MMAVLVINTFPSSWDRITNKLDSWNTFRCMGKYKWIPMFWAAIYFFLSFTEYDKINYPFAKNKWNLFESKNNDVKLY